MSLSNILVSDTKATFKDISVNSLESDTFLVETGEIQNLEVTDELIIPQPIILPTATPGAIASNDDELYFANSTGWHQVWGGPMMSGTSNGILINATTSELSLMPLTYVGSPTIGANKFKRGEVYHSVFAGTFSSKNANTLTLRGKINGATFGTFLIPLGTGVTGQHFEAELDFTIRNVGGPGVANLAMNFEFTYSDSTTVQFRGDRLVIIDSMTFNTTISNTFELTAQFSTNSANNSMQTQLAYLTRISG